MGRGRAKAKQTRVARDLKYRTFDTDFSSLERELRGTSTETDSFVEPDYSDYAERYGDEDDDADSEADDDYGRRIG